MTIFVALVVVKSKSADVLGDLSWLRGVFLYFCDGLGSGQKGRYDILFLRYDFK